MFVVTLPKTADQLSLDFLVRASRLGYAAT